MSCFCAADAQRVGGDAHLDQEHQERQSTGRPSTATNMPAMTPPTLSGVNSLANSRVTTSAVSNAEVVRQRDGAVDVAGAAQDELAGPRRCARASARVGGRLAPVLERAGAIDDARQPRGEHAERDAHAREQEHRAQRQLDQLRDVFGLQIDADHGAKSATIHHSNRARRELGRRTRRTQTNKGIA